MQQQAEPLNSIRDTATGIVRRLRAHGHEAFFAGGCVRDQLLGTEPKDIDIATSARPDEVRLLFRRCLAVGESFGVLIVLEKRHQFEVATFRAESDYEDGRRPSHVEFADAERDVQRRDFTINGLLYDPIKEQVLDFVGGQQDLKRGLIRAIGDPAMRFGEDHLRMLRAIRFAARLQFEIEAETFRAIQDAAPKIQRISIERIRDELTGILTSSCPEMGLDLLDESQLLAHVLPEIVRLKHLALSPAEPGPRSAFEHLRRMLELADPLSAPMAFAIAFLHLPELPEETSVRQVCRNLRFSNALTGDVCSMIESQALLPALSTMELSARKRFLRQKCIRGIVELCRLSDEAGRGERAHWEFCRQQLQRFSRQDLEPPPLIRGDDLLLLGLRPGPFFKEILYKVETEQLEGKIKTKEEALAFVQTHSPVPHSPEAGSQGS